MNENVVKAAGESLQGLAPRAVIEVYTLQRRGACLDQVEQFRRLYGNAVEVTEEAALRFAQECDWGWAADMLLPDRADRPFDSVTGKTWYREWRDRIASDRLAGNEELDKLKLERTAAYDALFDKGKMAEADAAWASFEDRYNALYERNRRTENESEAIWFARLYRLSRGITTDDWNKPKTNEATPAAASTEVA